MKKIVKFRLENNFYINSLCGDKTTGNVNGFIIAVRIY